MRKLICFLSLVVIFSCKSQSKNIIIPTINNKFEKFDIENFLKNSVRGTLIVKSNDATVVEDKQSYGFIKQVYKKDDIFCHTVLYYPTGKIKEKGITFNNGTEIGIWFYYDESGKLLKEENMDEGYDFKPADIIAYCEKNKIDLPKGYHDSGYQARVLKQDFEGKKVWRISHQIAGDKIEEIILDAKTGKELQKKTVPFYNP